MEKPFTLRSRKIPLWLKLAYTAFVAVVVPVYWYYWTPVNFLYFCDVALLLTVPALWLESSLLASMMAVSITLWQLCWQIDFIVYPLWGIHFPVNFAGYMYDPREALFTRGLSFFHFWLPIVLVWMVWRLGYDRRALRGQIFLSIVVLSLSYYFTTYPAGPAGNVNKVLGPGGDNDPPQQWMHPLLWLSVLMVGNAVAIYLPTHLVFCWLMPRRQTEQGRLADPSDASGTMVKEAVVL